MANVQLENGYTRIANEILDALAKTNIGGYDMRVLLVVVRQTYGYNQNFCNIPLGKFALMTGLRKAHVLRSLKKLYEMKLVTKCGNGHYRFHKNYDEWLHLTKTKKSLPNMVTNGKKRVSVTKSGNEITKSGNGALPNMVTSTVGLKDITHKDIIKDITHIAKGKETAPLQSVVLAYKVRKGYELEDKAWDKQYFKRFCGCGKNLIEYLGDSTSAIRCMNDTATEMESKGLEWTLETILKRAGEWKLKHKDKTTDATKKLMAKFKGA